MNCPRINKDYCIVLYNCIAFEDVFLEKQKLNSYDVLGAHSGCFRLRNLDLDLKIGISRSKASFCTLVNSKFLILHGTKLIKQRKKIGNTHRKSIGKP